MVVEVRQSLFIFSQILAKVDRVGKEPLEVLLGRSCCLSAVLCK